ncbi:MAG: diphthine--ammonia ligase [Oscillospiraceae bacterium]|nr:diphthine--ammonia ligase [Oscillospiraceae bacterium]
MENLVGKKFVASFSGGKDSTLSLYRAINAGLVPAGLITTYNVDSKRTWFHGTSEVLLGKVAESLGIPLNFIRTIGDEYTDNFEKALLEAKENGVEVCVFGDIDLQVHFDWCEERCENTGMIAYFPLKHEDRKSVVYDFIDSGFSTIITIVDTTRVSDEFLGKTLTREVVDAIEAAGADICGENGEYHTFVYDGPLFKNKIDFTIKERLTQDKYALLHIDVQ